MTEPDPEKEAHTENDAREAMKALADKVREQEANPTGYES